MYNTIINPITGNQVSINSLEGQLILEEYYKEYVYNGEGGSFNIKLPTSLPKLPTSLSKIGTALKSIPDSTKNSVSKGCYRNTGNKSENMGQVKRGVKNVSNIYKKLLLKPYMHKLVPLFVSIAHTVSGHHRQSKIDKLDGPAKSRLCNALGNYYAEDKADYDERKSKGDLVLNEHKLKKIVKELRAVQNDTTKQIVKYDPLSDERNMHKLAVSVQSIYRGKKVRKKNMKSDTGTESIDKTTASGAAGAQVETLRIVVGGGRDKNINYNLRRLEKITGKLKLVFENIIQNGGYTEATENGIRKFVQESIQAFGSNYETYQYGGKRGMPSFFKKKNCRR